MVRAVSVKEFVFLKKRRLTWHILLLNCLFIGFIFPGPIEIEIV